MEVDRSADLAEGRYGDAEFCGRADAVRQNVFGWGRCAHCASDWGQGIKSGGGGCSGAGGGACGVLPLRIDGTDGSLLGELLASRLADSTVLDVDDSDAAPISWERWI